MQSKTSQILGFLLLTLLGLGTAYLWRQTFKVTAASPSPLYIEWSATSTTAKATKTTTASAKSKKSTTTKSTTEKITSSSSPRAESSAPPFKFCDFKTFGAPSEAIILNEIAWMGSEEDPNAEWLELKNVSGRDIDLKGWQILSKDKKIKTNLLPRVLRPGDFYLLARSSDSFADFAENILPDQIYDGALSNSGAWLKIFDNTCHFVEEVNAENKWPAGSASAKKTMERKVASADWQTSDAVGGTPRAQNYIPPPLLNSGGGSEIAAQNNIAGTLESDAALDSNQATTSAKILIAVIQIAGSATDDDRITLYNPNPDSVDISDWKLRKRTKSGSEFSVKVLSGEVEGHGYYVWANSKHPTGADATSTQTLSADNSAALLDPQGVLIDAVAWGSGHTTPYIEGSAYPANPTAGQVLSRRAAGNDLIDTQNNADDFEIK